MAEKYTPFISNKTEHLSFKSGCVVRVAKHLKEDWFIVLHNNYDLNNFIPLLKSFIANVLKCKAHLKTKFKCVTMCSLVMSPVTEYLDPHNIWTPRPKYFKNIWTLSEIIYLPIKLFVVCM